MKTLIRSPAPTKLIVQLNGVNEMGKIVKTAKQIAMTTAKTESSKVNSLLCLLKARISSSTSVKTIINI